LLVWAFGRVEPLASFYALDFNPAGAGAGLLMHGPGARTGVGGVAFGAPAGLQSGGGTGSSDRQEVLVSSARGAPLKIKRYTFTFEGGVWKPDPPEGFDLYTELTTEGPPFNGEPIRDQPTDPPIQASQLSDGATVAGFSGSQTDPNPQT
jgi:hypothetical protein